MSIKGEREYLIKLKQNELGFVPAEIPLEFNGSVNDWKLELIGRGFWNGTTPKNYSDITLTISQWSAIVESIENFNSRKNEQKQNTTDNRSVRI